MIPDEQEKDKTSETEDKSRDGEDKGEEHCFYPEGGVGVGWSGIVTEEGVNYWGIAMGEEMLYRDTVWERSVVGVAGTEESEGGWQGGWEDIPPSALVGCMGLVVVD